MEKISVILAATDFSPRAQGAVEQAFHVARDTGAKVHLLHVIHRQVLEDLASEAKEDVGEVMADIEPTVLAKLTDAASAAGGSAQLHVLVGDPFEEMVRFTNEHAVDLLVLAANSFPDLRPGVGGFAARAVRKAPTRVMLVREPKEAWQKVVALTDFSFTSLRAVSQAAFICRRDSAELHIVHVYAPPWEASSYLAPNTRVSPEYREQYLTNLDIELKKFLEPIARELEGLSVVQHLVAGRSVRAAIVEEVRNLGADLIVLGTEGRTGLQGVFTSGTTAEHVLAHAHCSALAIKPDGFVYYP